MSPDLTDYITIDTSPKGYYVVLMRWEDGKFQVQAIKAARFSSLEDARAEAALWAESEGVRIA